MKKKLLVLSMDAMVQEDLAKMEKKPNFKRLFEKSARIGGVRSVYPTSTYPAHTALRTGCYPRKHGVWANFPLRTHSDGISHWPLDSKYVFAEDLFTVAKRAGLRTAAVFWPITGNHPHIDHGINEYFFPYEGELSRAEEVFAAQGADPVALRAVKENLSRLPTTRKSKELMKTSTFDDFIMGCTASLIRFVQPDLLMVHNCFLDSLRHRHGVFGERLDFGLELLDEWLGEWISALEDAGVYENTDFVLLSDHGQMNYTQTAKLNRLFAEAGLLDVAPDGTLYDWQAFAQSNGKSTTVYLRDITNPALYRRVYEFLRTLPGKYGVEAVFTKEELKERYGQEGPYSFMVEGDENTSFSNGFTGECVEILPPEKTPATHGYLPEKGPQPVFLATGPSFREGARCAGANMVDVAPTLAKTFGGSLTDADGKVLSELLTETK